MATPKSEAPVETFPLEGVFYTDGGCRSFDHRPASRGSAGWGVHGYTFTRAPSKTGAGMPKGYPSAEGYQLGDKPKAPFITLMDYVDLWGTVSGEGTNQVGELLAATHAIQKAVELKLTHLLIWADSEYVIKGLTEYLERWKKAGWRKRDGQPVANQLYWIALDNAKHTFESDGNVLELRWVKGHSGDPGNEVADKYATRGVFLAQQGLQRTSERVTEAKGYWKRSYEPSRMFSLPHWFFTVTGDMDTKSKDGRFVYHLGDIRESTMEFLGKPISDATFSVVFLKEEDKVLEQVHHAFENLAKRTMQGLVVTDLRVIASTNIANALESDGAALLILDKTKQIVSHVDPVRDGEPSPTVVGYEVRPPRLAFNAVNVMEALEDVLEESLAPPKHSRLVYTDITSVLYESVESKKKTTVKLKPEFKPGVSSVEVSVNYPSEPTKQKTLTLTFGQDLPDRNTLAALAVPGVSVRVVTWPESKRAFRFATLISANEDAGIWSGPYANLQFV